MKKLFFVFLLISRQAFGAIVHVQSNTNGVVGGGTTQAVAFGSNVTAGNLIIAYCYFGTQTNPANVTATDSLGQTLTQAVGQGQTTDGHVYTIFYKENSAGGADTVTCASTLSGTTRASVSEFSGVALSGSLDQTLSTQGASAAPASGNVTPGQNGELLLCASSGDTATVYTAGTDFTKIVNVPDATSTRIGAEYYIQPTATAHNGTWSLGTSNNWTALIATFKPAAGAVTATQRLFCSIKGGRLNIRGGKVAIR